MLIRPCQDHDIQQLCAIYNHYIEHTTITFETKLVSMDTMATRLNGVTATFPWLTCIEENRVQGYAYATRWREREAYAKTVEATIYLHPQSTGNGYGRHLYSALMSQLQALGYHVVLGCIALPNSGSVRLHESLGFTKVAHFPEVGRKFDRWLDVGYWQLGLSTYEPVSAQSPDPL